MKGILGMSFPDGVEIQNGNYENLTALPSRCHEDVSNPDTTAFFNFLQQEGQNKFAMRWSGTLGQGQPGNELLVGDAVDEFLFGKTYQFGKEVITTKIVPNPLSLKTPKAFITYNIEVSGIQVMAGAQTLKQIPLSVDSFYAYIDSGATKIDLPKSVCEAIKANADKSELELRFTLGRDGLQMLKLPLTPELVGSIMLKNTDVTFVNTAWGPFACSALHGSLNMGLHLMRWYDMVYDLGKKEITFTPKTPIQRLKFGTEEPWPLWIAVADPALALGSKFLHPLPKINVSINSTPETVVSQGAVAGMLENKSYGNLNSTGR